jgi:hypothetical protein
MWRGDSRLRGMCIGLRGEGCTRGVHTNHRCAKHYRQWLRHGRPATLPDEAMAMNDATAALLAYIEQRDDAPPHAVDEIHHRLRAALKTLAEVTNLAPVPRSDVETVIAMQVQFSLRDRRRIARAYARLPDDVRRARISAAVRARHKSEDPERLREFMRQIGQKGNAKRWGDAHANDEAGHHDQDTAAATG